MRKASIFTRAAAIGVTLSLVLGVQAPASAASKTGWTGPTTPIDGRLYMHNSTITDSPALSVSTRIWSMTGSEAPQGTMGVRARLFKSGVLCEAIDYQYNPWPATEMSFGTSRNCGDGWYNSHGFVSVWNDTKQTYVNLPTFQTDPIWVASGARLTRTFAAQQKPASADRVKVEDAPAGFTPAFGDNGTQGFVRDTDLETTLPENPSHATDESAPGDRIIPLFASDGAEVVGTFTITTG